MVRSTVIAARMAEMVLLVESFEEWLDAGGGSDEFVSTWQESITLAARALVDVIRTTPQSAFEEERQLIMEGLSKRAAAHLRLVAERGPDDV
jgi:hypothetical protein